MLNQHSLEEIAEIHNLLNDIKQEYKNGIQPILLKNSSELFNNPHIVPKLKKIQINRGLGLTAQNTNVLKSKHFDKKYQNNDIFPCAPLLHHILNNNCFITIFTVVFLLAQ